MPAPLEAPCFPASARDMPGDHFPSFGFAPFRRLAPHACSTTSPTPARRDRDRNLVTGASRQSLPERFTSRAGCKFLGCSAPGLGPSFRRVQRLHSRGLNLVVDIERACWRVRVAGRAAGRRLTLLTMRGVNFQKKTGPDHASRNVDPQRPHLGPVYSPGIAQGASWMR